MTEEARMSPERERLEEIRERVEAATEGPWKLAGKHAGYWIEAPGRLCIPHAKSDTIFIANARADIPWLLDQLEQAEQRLKALEDWLESEGYAPDWIVDAARPA